MAVYPPSATRDKGFVVNLLTAMDTSLVLSQGGQRGAAKYVNFLLSAANVVYRRERNARLNVVWTEETEIVDGANMVALRDMEEHCLETRPVNTGKWHENAWLETK